MSKSVAGAGWGGVGGGQFVWSVRKPRVFADYT